VFVKTYPSFASFLLGTVEQLLGVWGVNGHLVHNGGVRSILELYVAGFYMSVDVVLAFGAWRDFAGGRTKLLKRGDCAGLVKSMPFVPNHIT
jgi:hypothetical protein